MELISEAIVCNSSMRFSERTSMRMMTMIMKRVVANGQPTPEKNKGF
jgi:hypothetical protein